MRIRDAVWKKFGYGIRDGHSGNTVYRLCFKRLITTYGGVGGGVEGGEDDGLLVEGERLLIPAPPAQG
jgi:hypothetical protein